MMTPSLDRQLLERLLDIPEVALSGFSIREGLTGAGITILKGRTYFGSWRVTAGTLVWIYANVGDDNHFVKSVDEAVRHTLMLVLRNLETMRSRQMPRAMAS
jgi:hypothetical protein